jgi:hypothetical protein
LKRNWRYAAAAAALSVAAIVGAAACGGDDDAESGSSASQQAVDELTVRVQRNEMVTAVLAIGGLPLHDIDEAVQEGPIPSNAVPSMRTLARLTGITEWNSELGAAADQIHADALAFIEAAEADDMEEAKRLSTAVHEGVHQFTTDAWPVLAPGIAEAGGEHAAETPAAEGTPADDHGGTMPEAEVTP